MIPRTKHPLTRLPQVTEIALYLIREELKCRKLFESLYQVGLDDCFYQPHLDNLILACFEISSVTDEVFEKYNAIMDKHVELLEADNESLSCCALDVYMELREVGGCIK